MNRLTALLIATSCVILPTAGIAQSSESSSSESSHSSSSSVQYSTYSSVDTEQLPSSATSGQTNLTIEQVSRGTVYGVWTLIQPGNVRTESGEARAVKNGLPGGNYSIFAEPPAGAVPHIKLEVNGEERKSANSTQLNFTLQNGEQARISISYAFLRTGTVSVQSDPSGVDYILSGPNNFRMEGTTPTELPRMPEGQYKVEYLPFEGCPKPPAKGGSLRINERVSFDITIVCEEAERIRARQEPANEKFITVLIQGQQITFRDVPQESWFAKDVFEGVRRGIFTGHRDSEGNFSGLYKPGDLVSVAELAVIAHRAAAVEVSSDLPFPSHPGGRNKWFSGHLASAESKGWLLYSDGTVDPYRPATRGEVIATFLQAFDIPRKWQTGNVFRDVSVITPYAASIETAADMEVIGGTTDSNGNSTGLFQPSSPVNRAEISRITNTAVNTFRGLSSSSSSKR